MEDDVFGVRCHIANLQRLTTLIAEFRSLQTQFQIADAEQQEDILQQLRQIRHRIEEHRGGKVMEDDHAS